MNEVWQPVVGYEGLYEVSDQGRVRSLDRLGSSRWGNRTRLYKGTLLRQSINARGYRQVSLCKNGLRRNGAVHQMVANAFLGPTPSGMIVLHGPNGKQDNSLANIGYGTQLQNLRDDKLRDGTLQTGERHGRAKLTEELVGYIKASEKSGAQLARELHVSDTAIYNVRKGATWRRINPPSPQR